jgi:farnesyl-diphosphate farnesyltransferase
MAPEDKLNDLLQKTSRTFALTIPLLPEPLRREVGVAYLLFRIIDSFEDATSWPSAKRMTALSEFVSLMDRADPPRAAAAAAHWTVEPPLDHDGYRELISLAPLVLHWLEELREEARDLIQQHLARTAEGMARFVSLSDGSGALRLETPEALREYCFVVAGIVGQLLTELYLLSSPELAGVAAELRARAVHFGEGLQLVNILKDAEPDAAEGRVYLPRDLTLGQVFALAHADLTVAVEYTEILRTAQAHTGIVAFNALNARLAFATLRLLRDEGLGSKLSRVQLKGLTDDVMRSLDSGAPLSPDHA